MYIHSIPGGKVFTLNFKDPSRLISVSISSSSITDWLAYEIDGPLGEIKMSRQDQSVAK